MIKVVQANRPETIAEWSEYDFSRGILDGTCQLYIWNCCQKNPEIRPQVTCTSQFSLTKNEPFSSFSAK